MKDHATVPNLTGAEEMFRPSAYLKIFPVAAPAPAPSFHRILLAVNGEFSVYIDTPLSLEQIQARMQGWGAPNSPGPRPRRSAADLNV